MRWSPALRDLDWLVARPIAHRGLHDIKIGAVENTATAFSRAVEHDYAIECDLQLTADGEAVVFHDHTLDRLTEASGPVRAHTARALREFAFRAGKDHIETFGELLDQISGNVPLVIEIKSHWDGDDSLVLRAIKTLEGYRGPYGIMSFDPDIVAAVRMRAPQTVRGIVTDRTTDSFYDTLPFTRRLDLRYFTHMPRTMPHFISYRWLDLPFPPVSAFRMAGRPVISWTIRSREAAGEARRYSDQITFEGFLA
jgi:glycerophosphoryl diester phosphodiesterase